MVNNRDLSNHDYNFFAIIVQLYIKINNYHEPSCSRSDQNSDISNTHTPGMSRKDSMQLVINKQLNSSWHDG